MSLRCALTGHKADPVKARWNGGICFGECTHCRRAVVRGAAGSWRVPRGFRVVWRAVPREVEAHRDIDRQQAEIEQLWEPADAVLKDTSMPRGEVSLEELQAAEEAAAEDRSRDEGTGLFEWPLVARSASATETYVEPITEVVLVGPNPEPEEPRFAVNDFMDEQDDDLAWGDLRVRQ